ncbi:hypothetical protein SGFS_099120 [Streptomyces graminofaciens]|uniref:Uncharacterized protein n=1 Tax=Streptomyces graminofaciens TaxID=68212 RepID=A0ABM7FNA1_9ACTN|nr:hypothetical protein [Streptomyces graminofaciens]BBC38618.1 hypothetical protein SGFS_099120 [Streptomyces graminofaciens]
MGHPLVPLRRARGVVAEAWGDGGWDFPRLVTWTRFPAGNNGVDLQARMQNAMWGDANSPLKDGRFNDELSRAKKQAAADIPLRPVRRRLTAHGRPAGFLRTRRPVRAYPLGGRSCAARRP